jgi:hypothetical protein
LPRAFVVAARGLADDSVAVQVGQLGGGAVKRRGGLPAGPLQGQPLQQRQPLQVGPAAQVAVAPEQVNAASRSRGAARRALAATRRASWYKSPARPVLTMNSAVKTGPRSPIL